MEPPDLGRLLIVLGIGLVVGGLVLIVGGKIPLLGQLPGDLSFQRDGVTVHLPLATMVLVSLVLTLLLNLAARLFR